MNKPNIIRIGYYEPFCGMVRLKEEDLVMETVATIATNVLNEFNVKLKTYLQHGYTLIQSSSDVTETHKMSKNLGDANNTYATGKWAENVITYRATLIKQ